MDYKQIAKDEALSMATCLSWYQKKITWSETKIQKQSRRTCNSSKLGSLLAQNLYSESALLNLAAV